MDKRLSPKKAVQVAKIRAKQIREAYDARHPKATSPSNSTAIPNSDSENATEQKQDEPNEP